MELNRRQFLKGAALAGSAAALAGLAGCSSGGAAPAASSDEIDWAEETDVVIVGAGGGGLAAAVEVIGAGKEAIVVEVMSNAAMSNSALCAGMIQGAVTSIQKEAGIEDSVEEFDKYLAAVGEGFENPELRRLYAEKSGETIDWLVEQGANLTKDELSTVGTMVEFYTDVTPAVARMHWSADHIGAGFTEPLRKKAEEQGAIFEFNTQAVKLVTNADGEVVGLQVKSGTEEYSIKARLGVILNTAGYSRNPEMIRGFMTPAMPGMNNDRPIVASFGSPWQKGDGILMATAVGAKLTNMWQCYNMAVGLAGNPEDNSAGFISSAGIYVSTDGKRHVNESGNTGPGGRPTECAMADIWSQPEGYVWAIWDQSGIDAMKDYGGPVSSMSADLSEEVEAGYVTKADTLEELAAAIDVDPEVLEATVAEYNENIVAGTDPLGRVQGMPLTTPPYYVGRTVAVSPDTAGGVCVNTNAQVLSVFDDAVIGRLYAVGNMVGGFKGKINAGCGQALGWTYVSGRVAGQHIVTLEPTA